MDNNSEKAIKYIKNKLEDVKILKSISVEENNISETRYYQEQIEMLLVLQRILSHVD